MSVFLVSVLIPTLLCTSSCLHKFPLLLFPCTIRKLYTMANILPTPSSIAWLRPGPPRTQHVSLQLFILAYDTHPRGSRLGTKRSPSATFRSLFLSYSIRKLCSWEGFWHLDLLSITSLMALQMVERTNFSISLIYHVINFAAGINPT